MTYEITTEKNNSLSTPGRTVYNVKVDGRHIGYVIGKRRNLQWDRRQCVWFQPKKVAYFPVEHGHDPTQTEPTYFAETLKEAARSVAARAGATPIRRNNP